MGTSWSILARDVRSLDVDAYHRAADERIAVAGRGDGPEAAFDVILGARADRRADAGDPPRPEGANHPSHFVSRRLRCVHVVTGEAVDLDVDEPGGDPGSCLDIAFLDGGDASRLDGDGGTPTRLDQPAHNLCHPALLFVSTPDPNIAWRVHGHSQVSSRVA